MIGEGSRQSFVRRRKGRENFSTQSNEISFVALRVFKDSLHQVAGIKSDGLLLVLDVVVKLDCTDFDRTEIATIKICILELEDKREILGKMVWNLLLEFFQGCDFSTLIVQQNIVFRSI